MTTTSSKTRNVSSGRGKNGSRNGSGGKGTSKSRPSGRAWKLERASVTRRGQDRSRSNKYSATGDSEKKPTTGERTRAWVGGYTRADGRKVKGHYRELTVNGNSRSGSRRGSGGSRSETR